MRKVLFTTMLLVVSLPNWAHDVAEDLNTFFDGIGVASNVTQAQAYQSQAGGYYGAGSVYARTPVRQYSLVTLDMPHFRAGCAGIDLYNGSLSYISGNKLTELGSHIMKDGGAYAIDIMLATTVPEIKQVRDFLQTTVQTINQANINSCEAAQNLVGGLWPKTLASQQKICHDQRSMGKSGLAADYVQARMECATDRYQTTMQEASNDPERAMQVVLDKNLVWSILRQADFFKENRELSELVMNLTGSIIIDMQGKIKQIPSQADNSKLIHVLLGDTEGLHATKIWRCNDAEKCLEVHEGDMNIPEKSSLAGKVKAILSGIDEKIKKDEALSTYEKNFLSITPLPVLKFLIVLNSTQYGNAATDIDSYATLIATDMLQRYLTDILQAISRQTYGSSIPDALLKELRSRIEKANHSIALIEPHINQKFLQKMQLIEQVSKVEKQLSANMRIDS